VIKLKDIRLLTEVVSNKPKLTSKHSFRSPGRSGLTLTRTRASG